MLINVVSWIVLFRKEDEKDFIKQQEDELREKLYFLYLYHKNYNNEPNDLKKKIRSYYETELRYKGSFYRDKKRFIEFGNPLNWTTEQFKKLKIEPEELKYYDGIRYFEDFNFPSSTLLEIEIKKEVNILIWSRDEYGNVIINDNYEQEVTYEIKNMQQILNKIDATAYVLSTRQGIRYRQDSLDYLRVGFRLKVNNYYRRYISTNFVIPNMLEFVALNKLNNWLNETIGTMETGEKHPSPLEIETEDILTIEIEEIYLYKRTNQASSKLLYSKNSFLPYQIIERNLSSIKVIEVIQ